MSQMTSHRRLITVETEKSTVLQSNRREPFLQKINVTQVRHEVQKLQQLSEIYQPRAAVHGAKAMKSAGFQYTGTGDAVRCEKCRLEVSGWTAEMQPLLVHVERSPMCSFVKRYLSHRSSIQKDKIHESNDYENNTHQVNHSLTEADNLEAIRCRSFSHWKWKNDPFTDRMIAAGFFFCNVHDRTICLYCTLICHEWKLDSDDPIEVHKTLSPQCPYVLSRLINNPLFSCTITAIDDPTENMTAESKDTERTTPCHPKYSDINVRLESFKTWPNQSPSSNDLAAAGFFYQDIGNIVTCFNCNGSLKNWSSYDQPIIEHVRWFDQCSYAKQLCDDQFYQKILTAKRAKHSNTIRTTGISNNAFSFRPDDDLALVPRYVAARMDLPISQDLLDQNYKSAIIKRSWEDQLQLKQDDFADECDLVIACMILKKQIDRIQGNKDNIIVPSVQMRIVRERRQQPDKQEEPVVQLLKQDISENSSRKVDTQFVPTSVNSTKLHRNQLPKPEIKSNLSNPCLKCHEEEKQLACIPCGHLSTCIKCSQSLRTCPTCHRDIEAYIRVFI